MTKAYQRRFLRAPYFSDVLFRDKGHVFKAPALNISEGGILVTSMGYFPKDNEISFMALLPEFPLFKNYDLDKILKFNPENFKSRVIRFKAAPVRSENFEGSAVENLYTQIGFEINDINEFDKMKLSQYIESMTSNLIYLLVLFDTIADDESNILKLRKIAHYLGYNGEEKIAQLRKDVEHDYRSLQWL